MLLALTVLLTGAADGFASSLGENASRFVPLVGVLCVTTLSAGDLSSLIGLGTATMQDLADLTKLLLPTMAAALAGCGGVFTASAWQVGTLFAADALTTLIHELLLRWSTATSLLPRRARRCRRAVWTSSRTDSKSSSPGCCAAR